MTESLLDRRLSRRSMLRSGLLLSAGLAVAPAVVSCATPTGRPGPGAISLGLNRALNTLDNKLLQYDAALTVQRAVRQALTEIDADLKPRLVLADEFRLIEPTRWFVRLRPGIRYSDGSPVQVADVATALAMYPRVNGSFVGGFFPEWPGVEPIDATSFYLTTNRPVPVLDYLMSNILITPAAANRPEDLSDGVGTGPYVVTASDRGSGTFSLARNENYWGAPAHVEAVRVRFMPDESSRVVALRSGELDVIDSITPDSTDQISGLAGVAVQQADGVRLNQLFYNFRKPQGSPLADARVRRALTHAIDGKSLIENVMQNSATESRGVIPLSLAGAVETGSYTYDPGRTKAELRALGLEDLRVKIIWESGEFAADTDIMESVVQMLAAAGVAATLQQFEPGGDIAQWRQGRAGDWDILGNGYPSPTGLALTIMQGMYAGTAEKEATRDTYHGYLFPDITAVITQASEEIDPTRRDALLADAQRRIWDTCPMLWSFVPKAVLGRRTRIDGIDLRPTNSYDLAAVTMNGDS